MRFAKVITTAAVAVSLGSVPVLAQVSAAPTQLAPVAADIRLGADMADLNDGRRGGSWILAIGAAGLIILGAILLFDGKNKAKST